MNPMNPKIKNWLLWGLVIVVFIRGVPLSQLVLVINRI